MKVMKLKESTSRLSKYAGDHACTEIPMFAAIKGAEDLKKKIEDRFKGQNKKVKEFEEENKYEEKPKPIKDSKLKKLHLSEGLFEDAEDIDEEEYITDMFDFIYNLFVRDRRSNKAPYNPIGRKYNKFNYTSKSEDGEMSATVGIDKDDDIVLYDSDGKKLETAMEICDKFDLTYQLEDNNDDYYKKKLTVNVPKYEDDEPMLTIDYFETFDELKKHMPVSTRLKRLLTSMQNKRNGKNESCEKRAVKEGVGGKDYNFTLYNYRDEIIEVFKDKDDAIGFAETYAKNWNEDDLYIENNSTGEVVWTHDALDESCGKHKMVESGDCTGEWVYGEHDEPHCSNCGFKPKKVSEYCPKCGCHMEDEDELEESITVTKELDLEDFEPWSGAVDTFNELTLSELRQLQAILEDSYPDGMTETDINDILWFEEDWIAEMLGYEDWEALVKAHNGEDEDEEEEETEDEE